MRATAVMKTTLVTAVVLATILPCHVVAKLAPLAAATFSTHRRVPLPTISLRPASLLPPPVVLPTIQASYTWTTPHCVARSWSVIGISCDDRTTTRQ